MSGENIPANYWAWDMQQVLSTPASPRDIYLVPHLGRRKTSLGLEHRAEHDPEVHSRGCMYGMRSRSKLSTSLSPIPFANAHRQVRNPEYPERTIRTPCSVTSLDFSERHPTLLAVGMYDGTIGIYDTAREREVCARRLQTPRPCGHVCTALAKLGVRETGSDVHPGY